MCFQRSTAAATSCSDLHLQSTDLPLRCPGVVSSFKVAEVFETRLKSKCFWSKCFSAGCQLTKLLKQEPCFALRRAALNWAGVETSCCSLVGRCLQRAAGTAAVWCAAQREQLGFLWSTACPVYIFRGWLLGSLVTPTPVTAAFFSCCLKNTSLDVFRCELGPPREQNCFWNFTFSVLMKFDVGIYFMVE